MRGRKTQLIIVLTEEEHARLLQWSRSTSMPAGLVTRAETLLLVAQGTPLLHTARTVGLTEPHVRKWVKRFLQRRCDGLYDLPGRGRKPSFSPTGGRLYR